MNIIDRLQLAWTTRRQGRQIRRHGWAGAYVGDYRTAPTWAYTIGFDETLDHPEIVVCDATRPAATRLFWRVFDEVRSGALVIEDGLAWPPEEDCRSARTGFRHGLEAYQFVLSDAEGFLPWEAGYDERLRRLQPALYEPPGPGE